MMIIREKNREKESAKSQSQLKKLRKDDGKLADMILKCARCKYTIR